MTKPITKKEALKKITKGFLIELDKLEDVERSLLERNWKGSFFLSNTDVSRIRARSSVVKLIYGELTADILAKDELKDIKNPFPIGDSLSVKFARMDGYIDKLKNEDVVEILEGFLAHTAEYMSDAPTPERCKYQEKAEWMSDDRESTAIDKKRAALKEHALGDAGIFAFLAKLVKIVCEALGVKTSSEKMLEQAREDSVSVSPSI